HKMRHAVDFGSREYWAVRFAPGATDDASPAADARQGFEWLGCPSEFIDELRRVATDGVVGMPAAAGQCNAGAAAAATVAGATGSGDVAQPMFLAPQPEQQPKLAVLHIGCGTSDLGLLLRSLFLQSSTPPPVSVSDTASTKTTATFTTTTTATTAIAVGLAANTTVQGNDDLVTVSDATAAVDDDADADAVPAAAPPLVVNVDFVPAAVARGRRRELAAFGDVRMRWITADLLTPPAELHATVLGQPSPPPPHQQQQQQPQLPLLFDLIVDKSTSDAIACAAPGDNNHAELDSATPLLPLAALARSLAALARPGAVWCALSYSAARFDGARGCGTSTSAVTDLADAVPGWRLERRVEVPLAGGPDPHAPRIAHYVYVLRRE
ncbi:hypothetical protein HK405_008948, partial [Cladochytrium tenue]